LTNTLSANCSEGGGRCHITVRVVLDYNQSLNSFETSKTKNRGDGGGKKGGVVETL